MSNQTGLGGAEQGSKSDMEAVMTGGMGNCKLNLIKSLSDEIICLFKDYKNCFIVAIKNKSLDNKNCFIVAIENKSLPD